MIRSRFETTFSPWVFSTLSSTLFVGLVLGLVGAGCDLTGTQGDEGTERGGELGVAVQGVASQVEGMEISVERCDGTPVRSVETPLEDATLPGGIDAFEDRPYEADSEHRFADHFFTVDSGCYRATATPTDGAGARISECAPARSEDLQVVDGETTEILLVSQCRGAERGGIDVMGSINHPPFVESVAYRPSKFLTCPATPTVCVTATDPDEDPMRAEWSIVGGPTPISPLTKTVQRQTDGTLRECVDLEPGVGTTQIHFKVWDRLYDDGKLIDFDEYFRREGRSDRSNDEIELPLHVAEGQCGGGDAGVSDAGADAGPSTDVGSPPDSSPVTDTSAETDADTREHDGGGTSDDTGDETSRDTSGSNADAQPDVGDCDCESSVTLLDYDVTRNGAQRQISDLSDTEQGDDVTVNFSVDSACSSVEVSLAAYEASGSSFGTSIPQTLYDSTTGTFGPGNHSLGAVSIPACFYQVEFVCGPVLTGEEINSGKRYGSRKIDWHNAGANSCTSSASSCTRTRGYWSNHHDYASNSSQNEDWPQPEDEHNTICGQTWLSTINLKGARGSAWRILAPQWIAAKLNVAANASAPLAVKNALGRGETMLTSNCGGIPAADRKKALSIKDLLDDYNNGRFGTQSCP